MQLKILILTSLVFAAKRSRSSDDHPVVHHKRGTTEVDHGEAELRRALDALTPEDYENRSLVTFLTRFQRNARRNPDVQVRLIQPLRVVLVQLLVLDQLFPKDQMLSKLDKASFLGDREVLYFLIDFCEKHGINFYRWAARELRDHELDWVYEAIDERMDLSDY